MGDIITAGPRHRVSAAALRRGERDVLMVKHRRRDGTEYWQLPGGGLGPDEEHEVAVLRELAEETGLHGTIVRFLFTLPYKLGNSSTYLVRISDDDVATLGFDPEETDADHRKLVDVAWVDIDEVRTNPEIRALLLVLSLPHISDDPAVRSALQ